VTASDGQRGLAGQLRQSRVRAGLTQQQLAARSVVSVRTIRALEKGLVTRPQAASLHRLAEVLGVDPAVLLPPGSGEGGAASGTVRVDVLGPLAVYRDGRPLAVASPKLATLLGLLALQPGSLVGFEEIIDVLWETDPPRTARQLVHAYAGSLRKVLDPDGEQAVLPRSEHGYRLRLGTGQSDVARFLELLAQAERAAADGPEATAWLTYTEALACWRGPLLAGAGEWPHTQPAAIALAGRRTAAALAWADLGTRLGHFDSLVPGLRVLAVEQPLHEGLAARLMLALAGAGQQAEALAVYDAIRERLDSQLGLDPGPEVRSAHLRVLRGELPRAAATTEPAPPPAQLPVPAQLPTDCVGFTGRADELRALDRLLADDGGGREAPVALITGMGGVGKSALAVRWARTEQARYPDGQLYADLRGHAGAGVGAAKPAEVIAGFLAALGERAERIPADEGQAAALLRTKLAGQRVLMLLDNALDAQQVRPLLPASRGCAAIVTARDRLTGLVARDGAGVLALAPLPEHESAALLGQILGSRGASELADQVATLARLCAHLPLALRIAAANLATRPSYRLTDYVERLSSGDRLSGLAVPDDPQAAVRSTFDLSCDVLTPAERRLFRLAGMMPGADLTAWWAAALAGITIGQAESLLDRLAARNLVDDYAPGRYRLHDLLRLYATELLDAEEDEPSRLAALDRLGAQALAALASAAGLLYPHLLHLPAAAEQDQAVDRTVFATAAQAQDWLDAERVNLVALIVRLAGEGKNDTALRLADRLTGYFFLRSSVVDWQASATAAQRAATAARDPAGLAAAHLQLGMLHQVRADLVESAEHFAEAVRLAREANWTAAEAVALNNLASAHWATGRAQETIDGLTQALNLHRRSGRKAGEAVTLANLAAAHLELARGVEACGDQASAERHRHEALGLLDSAVEMHRDLGDARNEAETQRLIAEARRDLGEVEQAAGPAREALALACESADLRFEAIARSTLATILVRLGESEAGLIEHKRAVELAERLDEQHRHVVVQAELADSLTRLGRRQEALAPAGQAAEAAIRLGLPFVRRRISRFLPEAIQGP
jgi:DNA-binding SARP family transcriptional activator/DNA-binding XRE family transcriptional regulator